MAYQESGVTLAINKAFMYSVTVQSRQAAEYQTMFDLDQQIDVTPYTPPQIVAEGDVEGLRTILNITSAHPGHKEMFGRRAQQIAELLLKQGA